MPAHLHTACRPSRSCTARARGFTLIELMITVAVIAILSAVALPSYREHIRTTNLTEATNGLSSVRANMERHFQDNRTYASVGTTFITPCADATVANRTFGKFIVSCSGTPDGSTFTLQAVGSGPVNGFTYTVNQQDVRATTAVPSGSGFNTCASRWLMKKGETC